jgi:hypothetical protein
MDKNIKLFTYSQLFQPFFHKEITEQLWRSANMSKSSRLFNSSIFVEKLRRRQWKSRGRRKLNHETIYRITEWQVLETMEAGHLNDLTYDPIVLYYLFSNCILLTGYSKFNATLLHILYSNVF